MIYSIGVTGHRNLISKESVIRSKVKELIIDCFESSLKKDISAKGQVISGMALGFDQLVAEESLNLEIPFVAAVPCDNQDSLWNTEQKARYANLLTQAKEVVVVNPGPYFAWKMHARNKWIVDHSNVMVVHWNKLYEGGTGACMKLVKAKQLSWHNTVE